MNTVKTTLASILLSLHVAAAAPVAQHEPGGMAADAQGNVTAWHAPGGAAMTPFITHSPAWAAPRLEAAGIAFGTVEDPAAPLSPDASATVATLFLVATAGGGVAERPATLVEAPGASVSVAPHAAPTVYDPDDAAGLTLRVNGAETLAVPDGAHIVEVDFAAPMAGADVRIGGASASAGWGQTWRGHVLAAVAFAAPPDGDIRQVVRHSLAKHHGVEGEFPAPGREAVLRAMALGFNTHGDFSTRLILR